MIESQRETLSQGAIKGGFTFEYSMPEFAIVQLSDGQIVAIELGATIELPKGSRVCGFADDSNIEVFQPPDTTIDPTGFGADFKCKIHPEVLLAYRSLRNLGQILFTKDDGSFDVLPDCEIVPDAFIVPTEGRIVRLDLAPDPELDPKIKKAYEATYKSDNPETVSPLENVAVTTQIELRWQEKVSRYFSEAARDLPGLLCAVIIINDGECALILVTKDETSLSDCPNFETRHIPKIDGMLPEPLGECGLAALDTPAGSAYWAKLSSFRGKNLGNVHFAFVSPELPL